MTVKLLNLRNFLKTFNKPALMRQSLPCFQKKMGVRGWDTHTIKIKPRANTDNVCILCRQTRKAISDTSEAFVGRIHRAPTALKADDVIDEILH